MSVDEEELLSIELAGGPGDSSAGDAEAGHDEATPPGHGHGHAPAHGRGGDTAALAAQHRKQRRLAAWGCFGLSAVLLLIFLTAHAGVSTGSAPDGPSPGPPPGPTTPVGQEPGETVDPAYAGSDGFATADHVLLLGLDGLGARFIRPDTPAPTLRSLMAGGASTLDARNVMPTQSGPNWAAISCGAGPEETGVDGNRWYSETRCTKYGFTRNDCVGCERCKRFAANATAAYAPGGEDAVAAQVRAECRAVGYSNATCDTLSAGIVGAVLAAPPGGAPPPREVCARVPYDPARPLSDTWCRDPLPPLPHGHTSGAAAGGAVPVSVFDALRAAGRETLLFTDHSVVFDALGEDSVDDARLFGRGLQELIYAFSLRVLDESRPVPSLMYLHFDSVDHAGHNAHWGSPAYEFAIGTADAVAGEAVRVLEQRGVLNRTLIVAVADHGGSPPGSPQIAYTPNGSPSHGYSDDLNARVPFMLRGPGVVANRSLHRSYITLKRAPATVLHALGVAVPPTWSGTPVAEAWPLPVEPEAGAPRPVPRRARRVVLAVVSGFGSAAAASADLAPSFASLRSRGVVVSDARATMPCTPATNLASVLMGAGPEEHGVCHGTMTWVNCTYEPYMGSGAPPAVTPLVSSATMWADEPEGPLEGERSPRFPHIFDVAKGQNYDQDDEAPRTSLFYRSAWVDALVDPGGVRTTVDSRGLVASDADAVDRTIEALRADAAPQHLAVVELTGPREAGHEHGFDSDEYRAAVTAADAEVGRLLAELEREDVDLEESLLVVTADVGADQREHGGASDPRCMFVPLATAGMSGVLARGDGNGSFFRNYDAAPIAAHALGLVYPRWWQGHTHESVLYPLANAV